MADSPVDASGSNLRILYDRYGLILSLSRNGLEAFARYSPNKAEKENVPDDIYVLDQGFFDRLLSTHKIMHGVDDKAVKSFLSNPPPDEDVLIARGTPPVHGEDAKIIFVVTEKDTGPSPKELEDGKVDLKDLNLNINVPKGELLAKKTPPTAGEPGRSVRGEEIPQQKGKDLKFPPGKNTKVTDDGLQLLAEIDGTTSRTTSSFSVVEVYSVPGDVDYSTGNISFVGSVEVKGNVLSGFGIEAKGDITIGGIVEGAHLVAGGNVLIRSGIQGGEKAVIQAGGSISAKLVNGAKLVAGDSIRIDGPVMHGDLEAGDGVILTSRNGILNGGITRATHLVEAESIGSEMGVATTIEVGLNPKLVRRKHETDELLKQSQNELKKLDQVTDALKKMKKAQGELPESREKTLLESIRKRYALLGKIRQTEKDLEEIENELSQSKSGSVKVRGNVYAGVTIQIRSKTYKVKNLMKAPVFQIDEGRIVTG